MLGWLEGFGLGGALLAVALSVHGAAARVPVVRAQCVVDSKAALVAGIAADSWRSAVKRANLAVTQSRALALWGFSKVRLVFPNGGWIEFEPSRAAIATDAMPPLSAMQFGQMPSGTSPPCE